MTDHLSDELVDQDDANVITCQEAPAERFKEEDWVRSAENMDKLTNTKPNSIQISVHLTF